MVLTRLPVLNGIRTELGASWRRGPSDLPTSDHFDGKGFLNLEPSSVLTGASVPKMIVDMVKRGREGQPRSPVPLVTPELLGPAADLAVTWLGHASVLLEIDGVRVLADPVWSDRVSPTQRIGPKRMHAVPISLEDLPPIDIVLISHDHYDHLDLSTVQHLSNDHNAEFVVPLGVDGHLRSWGVPDDRIIALDWNEEHQHGELRLTCVQARHFSGRGLTRNDTLWASWALCGPTKRVFFAGDTGYTSTFAEVGERFGAFDLTLVPIGAYDERWADIHLNPEEAVRTHLDVRGEVLLPIHWATFNLAFHPWSEPVRRLLTAAEENGVQVVIPRPGDRLTQLDSTLTDRWWETV